jgi:hypothetical protein
VRRSTGILRGIEGFRSSGEPGVAVSGHPEKVNRRDYFAKKGVVLSTHVAMMLDLLRFQSSLP